METQQLWKNCWRQGTLYLQPEIISATKFGSTHTPVRLWRTPLFAMVTKFYTYCTFNLMHPRKPRSSMPTAVDDDAVNIQGEISEVARPEQVPDIDLLEAYRVTWGLRTEAIQMKSKLEDLLQFYPMLMNKSYVGTQNFLCVYPTVHQVLEFFVAGYRNGNISWGPREAESLLPKREVHLRCNDPIQQQKGR